MKNTIAILICFAFIGSINCQSLSPTVYPAFGETFTGTNAIVSSSLGECLIETFTGAEAILSQGFHQPWDYSSFVDSCYSLSGKVYSNNTTLANGIIHLYESASYYFDGDTNNIPKPIKSFFISDGYYSFSSVCPGYYKLMAVPFGSDSWKYYPTYFVNASTWDDAYSLHLKANTGGVYIELINKPATAIEQNSNTEQLFYCYPNPVTDKLNLFVYLNKNSTVFVQLNDISGREISSKEYNTHKGDNTITLPTEHLSAGIYIGKLIVNEETGSNSTKQHYFKFIK